MSTDPKKPKTKRGTNPSPWRSHNPGWLGKDPAPKTPNRKTWTSGRIT